MYKILLVLFTNSLSFWESWFPNVFNIISEPEVLCLKPINPIDELQMFELYGA